PWLRVRGERIEAIGSLRDSPPPALDAGESRFDYPDCTILPGLIDTHVHLTFVPLETAPAIVEQVTRDADEQLTAHALTAARAALHAGITTVRDCGGRGAIVQAVRDRLRRGEAEGADVLACGAPITTTRG